MHLAKPIRRVAILGNFPPRKCGIATFTADLAAAIASQDSELRVDAIAMSDRKGYDYPSNVCFEIEDHNLASYSAAADFINRNAYDVLSIQHEYGIFGGPSGEYVMHLARAAKMPIVTTLHTILREPSASQRAVLDELLQLSERVVVMSERAIKILIEVHGIAPEKIAFIPHGVPHISKEKGKLFRKQLGVPGPMILTFGLLSPDKGIQYVIQAMPEIVKRLPDAVYFVVGATHPNVRAAYGEVYRESLINLAQDLGVSPNVRFVDRFVSIEELVQYLGATDIYITPYLNENQITSGTLAYSVGAGKAVISTPYGYAEELLAEDRGILVPFRNSEAVSNAIIEIYSEPDALEAIGNRAYEFGKKMLWPQVGESYLRAFSCAKAESVDDLRSLLEGPTVSERTWDRTSEMRLPEMPLPEMRLRHLFDLSDDTGVIQHANFTIPNRAEGYCVDDNARALILTTQLGRLGPLSPEVTLLQSRYLSFVVHALNPANDRFRNFMSYERTWLEEAGSEDSQGRALWSLGVTVRYCKDDCRRELARITFDKAAPKLLETSNLRTWGYSLVAADEYLKAFPQDPTAKNLLSVMANRILTAYRENQDADWPWFEPMLTYGNARLSQAMILAGQTLDHSEMVQVGLGSLGWLMKVQTVGGVFAPIGSDGFYYRGKERAFFDQQPIEAASTVSACLSAHRLTADRHWYDLASLAFRWFLGENMLGRSVYDPSNGGCRDGLHSTRLNQNQGAESTISFLCARTDMQLAMTRLAIPPVIVSGSIDVK